MGYLFFLSGVVSLIAFGKLKLTAGIRVETKFTHTDILLSWAVSVFEMLAISASVTSIGHNYPLSSHKKRGLSPTLGEKIP